MSQLDIAKAIFGNDGAGDKVTMRYGTAQSDSSGNKLSVKLDGSDEPITVTCMETIKAGQRVTVYNSAGLLKAVCIGSGTIGGNVLSVDEMAVSKLFANDGFIGTLHSNVVYATVGNFGDIYANAITTGTLDAELVAADLTETNTLRANFAHISDGEIDNAKINYADVGYLDAGTGSFTTIFGDKGIIKGLTVVDGQFTGTLDATNVNIANLDAGKIDVAYINGIPMPSGKRLQELLELLIEADSSSNIKQRTPEDVRAELDALKAIADNAIETWSYAGAPTATNAPAVNWTTQEERARHIGDLYYDTDTGFSYRYLMDGETGVFSWQRVSDSDVAKALADLAALSQDYDAFKANLPANVISAVNADFDSQAGASSLKGKVNSLITASANEIRQTVSETYETKTDAAAISDRLATAESSITQNAGQIALKANRSDVYSKGESEQLVTEAKAEIEVITDGISNAVSLKANRSDVYTKGESDQKLFEVQSEIQVTADGISAEVAKKVDGNEVISKINQSAEAITINAEKLDLQGYATFTDLAGNGTTTINGSNIKTGALDANLITFGTMSGDRLGANSVVTDKLQIAADGSDTGKLIVNGSVTAKMVGVGELTAENMNTKSLEGKWAMLGNNEISNNSIHTQGKTAYNSPTNGYFIGGGKVGIGTITSADSGAGILWDGSNLYARVNSLKIGTSTAATVDDLPKSIFYRSAKWLASELDEWGAVGYRTLWTNSNAIPVSKGDTFHLEITVSNTGSGYTKGDVYLVYVLADKTTSASEKASGTVISRVKSDSVTDAGKTATTFLELNDGSVYLYDRTKTMGGNVRISTEPAIYLRDGSHNMVSAWSPYLRDSSQNDYSRLEAYGGAGNAYLYSQNASGGTCGVFCGGSRPRNVINITPSTGHIGIGHDDSSTVIRPHARMAPFVDNSLTNGNSTYAWKDVQSYSFTNKSSILTKENVNPLTDDEARKILGVQAVTFDYKAEHGGLTDQRGVIAEQVAQVIPSVVTNVDGLPIDTNGTPGLGVDYSKFVPYLIRMVQIQQAEINELRSLVNGNQ